CCRKLHAGSVRFPDPNKNAKPAVDTKEKRVSIAKMVRIFAVLLLSASAVFAQTNPTAYDALRTVGNQVNRDFVNRVVSVTGVDGNPQPSTWRILIDDPNARGGIREVEVTDGREGDVGDEERSGDNRIMRSVRHMFYRAREQAQETFKRVRHNFADYIRGND